MEDKTYFLIGAGAAAVLLALMALKKGVSVVGDAANAINPMNNDNVINRGFLSVYGALTDGEGTLGTDIYDATHKQYDGSGNVIINAPGQPGYDKTKWATDIYGNPDPIAGWMNNITSAVWGD